MPWKEHRPMSSKREFVEAANRRGANISELCREHGISRQTGHKWLKRYRQGGYEGLEELSRRPGVSPSATGHEVVQAVLALRDRHPSWGPKKLSRVLTRDLGDSGPSAPTVARLLKAAGKIRARRPPVRVWHVEGRPHVEAKAPNDLWTIDFKGWWRAKNGERCEPLTVRDAMSRLVLAVVVVASTRASTVRRVLERLFTKYGVPSAMLMDNGSPWISTRARAGLTTLSVWLVSLGIRLYRSRVSSPQDNGGHERMHRDLNELKLSPGGSRRAQQPLCNRWTLDFNHVRPHDALGGKTPAEVYGSPPRRPLIVRVPVYPAGFVTRRVLTSGVITMSGDRVSIGRPLVGQLIGLRYETGLRWRAFFFECDLGTIEIAGHDLISTEHAGAVAPAVNPNEGIQPATPVSA
jgi:transposase InsO family protein